MNCIKWLKRKCRKNENKNKKPQKTKIKIEFSVPDNHKINVNERKKQYKLLGSCKKTENIKEHEGLLVVAGEL